MRVLIIAGVAKKDAVVAAQRRTVRAELRAEGDMDVDILLNVLPSKAFHVQWCMNERFANVD